MLVHSQFEDKNQNPSVYGKVKRLMTSSLHDFIGGEEEMLMCLVQAARWYLSRI